jgi:hypothetical protein
MISTASGRSALIVAVGLLVSLASPVTAATDADDSTPESKSGTTATVTQRPVRHAWHHRRHYTHRRSHPVATKTDDKEADQKVATTDAAPNDGKAPNDNRVSSNIPPSIANANAQMLLAGVQLSAAAAIPSGADAASMASDNSAKTAADNGTFMVAADQLNDVDKTLQESSSTPAAADAAPAVTTASPPPVAAAATMTSESSTWDQTSLIGKIFIGFGALLTMASAARMFIG